MQAYLGAAEDKSAEEALLNVLAVAKAIGFDRMTLKKYTLHQSIAAAVKEQGHRNPSLPGVS